MKTSYAVAALSAALTLGIAPAVLANDAVSAPATPRARSLPKWVTRQRHPLIRRTAS